MTHLNAIQCNPRRLQFKTVIREAPNHSRSKAPINWIPGQKTIGSIGQILQLQAICSYSVPFLVQRNVLHGKYYLIYDYILKEIFSTYVTNFNSVQEKVKTEENTNAVFRI